MEPAAMSAEPESAIGQYGIAQITANRCAYEVILMGRNTQGDAHTAGTQQALLAAPAGV